MIWSVWSWTALTRSALGLFFRFAFAISISSIPASSSATIIIVEVVGLHDLLFPPYPRFGRGTVPALAGFEPNSPPVMEPVGVVRDEPVVGLFLLEFDLGKRDLDLFVLINPDAVQPSLLIELVFYGRVQPGDRNDHLLAGERAGFRPVGNEERELQIRRQVAVVGHQSLGGDIGERVVVGQPEGHTDPIILVLLRQRRRLDIGWLLDWGRRSVVQFEVLLTQAHGLEIQPVPLTSLVVDRVDTR